MHNFRHCGSHIQAHRAADAYLGACSGFLVQNSALGLAAGLFHNADHQVLALQVGGAFADLQTCHGGKGNHVVSLGARNIHVYGAAALYRFAAGGFGIHNGACGNALVLHIFAYNLKAAIL